jgi:hypothetical protein
MDIRIIKNLNSIKKKEFPLTKIMIMKNDVKEWIFYGFYNDKDLIGIFSIYCDRIESFETKKHFSGYGRKMFKTMTLMLVKQNHFIISLHSLPMSSGFYKKMGMIDIGEDEYMMYI